MLIKLQPLILLFPCHVFSQIVDYPIVYSSEEFSRLLGYPKSEVMRHPAKCDFMAGTLTDGATTGEIGKEKTLSPRLPRSPREKESSFDGGRLMFS